MGVGVWVRVYGCVCMGVGVRACVRTCMSLTSNRRSRLEKEAGCTMIMMLC
jgi:hypothetical protein